MSERKSTTDTIEEQEFLRGITREAQGLFTVMGQQPVITIKMIEAQGEMVSRLLNRLIILDKINKNK